MTYYVVVRLAPGTDVSRAFPLSALYARHFTCVLTCLWACVPVQRMARDALCATRVWDAAEPEVIYTHALLGFQTFAGPVRGRSERSYCTLDL